MFQQGDQVVHRIHGAGTIVAIVRPDNAPKDCPYYEVDLVASDTRLMVPMECAEDILRPLSSSDTVDRAMRVIQRPPTSTVEVGRDKRRQPLWGALWTGQTMAVAEVIRGLRAQGQRRKLSFTDRQILKRATTFLASEIAVVKGIPFDQAERQVEELIAV